MYLNPPQLLIVIRSDKELEGKEFNLEQWELKMKRKEIELWIKH